MIGSLRSSAQRLLYEQLYELLDRNVHYTMMPAMYLGRASRAAGLSRGCGLRRLIGRGFPFGALPCTQALSMRECNRVRKLLEVSGAASGRPSHRPRGVPKVSGPGRMFLIAEGQLHNFISLRQLPTFIQPILQAEFDCLSNIP